MKKLTYLVFIFIAMSIMVSVPFAGAVEQSSGTLTDTAQAQDPLPTDNPTDSSGVEDPVWWDDAGAMPPLVGGKQADRPVVFIEPAMTRAGTEAVTELTIDVWYGNEQDFGKPGNPQEWVNILGNVSVPEGDSIKTLTYSLNGGPDLPLAYGPDKRRLQNEGDFNVEMPYQGLDNGANTVTIKATDNNDQLTTKNVTVNYTPNRVWPENYVADWGAASSVPEVAQVVDGKWDINPSGKLYPVEVGYDRLVAMGEMNDPNVPKTWTDYEVTVPIKVKGIDSTGFNAPSNGPGIGIIQRWQGQTQDDAEEPRINWDRTGGLGWYRWQKDGTEGLELRSYDKWIGTSTAKELEFDVQYIFKMSVQSPMDPADTRAYYRLKMWEAGDPEPVEWDLKGYSESNNTPSGSAVLIAHHVDAEFGDVTIEPLAGKSFFVTAGMSGQGSVGLTPNPDPPEAGFTYGSTVRVNASPAPNNILDSWSGDVALPGTINPLILDVTMDISVIANFVQADPGTLTVQIEGQGDVTKSPNKALYDGGEIVTLTAFPSAGYIFSGWSGDLSGTMNPDTVQIAGDREVTATFIALGEASPISDDFSQCSLDTELWSFINPAGDASVNATGTTVEIVVPGGAAHAMWPTINRNAPRLMQDTEDQDFEVEIKFNSIPTQKFQIQGFLVEEDVNNWLRFDIFSDGSKLKMFAGGVANGSTIPGKVTTLNTGGSELSEIYLRVNRVGNVWTQTYSLDGATWLSPQVITQEIAVASSGIFAANEPDGTAPDFTLTADYFKNTAFPLGNTGYLLAYTVVGTGDVQLSPDPDAGGRYGCNQVVTLQALPAASFTGWSGDLSGSANPAQLTMNGNKSVTAFFGVEVVDYRLFLPLILKE